MSGGSFRNRKFNFDRHACVLPGELLITLLPLFTIHWNSDSDPLDYVNEGGCKLFTLLLVVSKTHPSTRKHFQSSDSYCKEITRHMFSNYWYIIHPYSKLRYKMCFINLRDESCWRRDNIQWMSLMVVGDREWHCLIECPTEFPTLTC